LQFKDLGWLNVLSTDLARIMRRSEATNCANINLFPLFQTILDFLGALWHLLNFLAPPAFIGLVASAAARLLWRRDLAGVSVLRLWAWSSGLALVAALVALVVLGRDGKIVNYSAMVLACAAGLWWAGFGRGR
jgi:hypothetical protein